MSFRTDVVRGLYAEGRIDEDELERRLEEALLRDQPTGHPVPDGWQPLPPCEHNWVDVTAFGSPPEHLCVRCGDRDVQL